MASNAELAKKEHAALTRLETAIRILSERFGVAYAPAPFFRDTRYYEAAKLESYADFLEQLDQATTLEPADEPAANFRDDLIETAYLRFDDDERAGDPKQDFSAFKDAVLFVLSGGAEPAPADETQPEAPQSDETAPQSDETDAEASEADDEKEAAPDANVDELAAKKEAEREKRRARDAARKAKQEAEAAAAAEKEASA